MNRPFPDSLDETTPAVAGVGHMARQAAASLLIRHALGFVLNILGTVVLVKALGPIAWGVYAIAYVVQGSLALILERGTAGYLIQRRAEPTAWEVGNALGLQLVLGSIASLAVIVSIPGAVRLFGTDDIGSLMLAVAAAVALYAVRAIPLGVLERSLRYGRVSAIELADIAVFNAVAIGGVVLGFGLNSMAVAIASRALVSTGLAWVFGRVWVEPRFSWNAIRDLIKFAAPYTGSNALLLVNAIAAPALVGTTVGVGAFGALQLANSLIQYPLSLNWILARVAFPAYSRVFEEPDAVRASIESATRVFLRYIGTATLFVAASAMYWVPIVFGDAWLGVIPIMLAVAPAVALYGALTFVTAGLSASGRVTSVFSVGVAFSLLYISAAALLVPLFGALAIPIAFSIAAGTVAAPLYIFRRTLGGLSLGGDLLGFVLCSALLIPVAWLHSTEGATLKAAPLLVAIALWPMWTVRRGGRLP